MEKKNCGVKRCNVRQGLKAACLYFAAKDLRMPRGKKEIAQLLGCETKVVGKGCNSFQDIMGGQYVSIEPDKPSDFLERFCQMLEVPYKFEVKMRNIVDFAERLDILNDCTPTSITSACIFYMSKEYNLGITKEDIKAKCGTSPVITIKTYKCLMEYQTEIESFLE